ncbi:MAG TPA: DUF5995 family protein [Humisphaera sp.]|jgi:hypothetical protein|nr:DUF5995 family protein [Humisphaera sp.]
MDPLNPTPAVTVADVIQKMRDIDAALSGADGLKWFNYLYLAVTLEVQKQLMNGTLFFNDPAWTDRLDVVANRSVAAARQAAWDHSQAFWLLRGVPAIQSASLSALDGTVELAGNGLMIPVL